MGNEWILQNESRVFSIVQAKTKDDIVAQFPKARFTTKEENINSNTKFPTIYIAEMSGGSEVGSDLEGQSINGVVSTFQAKVLTDTSKNDATKVMGYILNAFKDLRFNLVGVPVTTTNDNVYVCIARFRRVIGASDKL